MQRSDFIDPQYLRGEQYRDDSNLSKRMYLHQHYSTNPIGWHRWLIEHFLLPETCQVLELGAGPGSLWVAQGALAPAGWQLTLSDFSAGMVRKACASLANQSRAYRFAVLDAQILPFADGSFDAVIANHMLYHVPDRPRAFAEIRRVLRPGGRLYAATNGYNHLKELAQWTEQTKAMAPEKSQQIVLGASRQFSLENGQEQLAPFFSSVQLETYPDALEVTEVQPLMDYIDSMMGDIRLPQHQPAVRALRAFFEEELQQKESIHISKESGLFCALR